MFRLNSEYLINKYIRPGITVIIIRIVLFYLPFVACCLNLTVYITLVISLLLLFIRSVKSNIR